MMADYCVDVEMKTHYLKRAADLGGYPISQHNLALVYGQNNENENYLHYLTLAASQGYVRSCGLLGYIFLHAQCGMTRSYVLAKHHAGKN